MARYYVSTGGGGEHLVCDSETEGEDRVLAALAREDQAEQIVGLLNVQEGDASTEAEMQARSTLGALLDAMDEQLDAADVEGGAEPAAYKSAVSFLGRPPRRAMIPAHVRTDGTYVLVVVFERELEEDEQALKAQKRTPAEHLAVELQQACDHAHIAGRFRVAEPSVFAAKGFATAMDDDDATLSSDAEACTIGPVAVPVIRGLLRALGSRNTTVITNAREQATVLLSKVNNK